MGYSGRFNWFCGGYVYTFIEGAELEIIDLNVHAANLTKKVSPRGNGGCNQN